MEVAYKAFQKDLSCTARGNKYQYQKGIWHKEPKAKCTDFGFHSAKNPLDCLYYYPQVKSSRYFRVLVDGDINEDCADSKISSTKIKLEQEMTLAQVLAYGLQFMVENPFLKNASCVGTERQSVNEYFAVVRGKRPIAKGGVGKYLAFAKEMEDSKEIEEIALYQVDGVLIKQDTWYDSDGKEVCCEQEKDQGTV